jgi:Flp pilus assembly protein TadG
VAYPGLSTCLRDTRGNITIIAAVCIVSLLLVLVMAIDVASQVNTKKHMQAALDAASLTGAKALSTGQYTEDEIKIAADSVFKAGMLSSRGDLICDNATVLIDDDTGDVSVESKCGFPAMLGGSLTSETIYVTNRSTAQSAQNDIDVAMVLDISRSMYGSKIAALKNAAKEAARILVTAREPGSIRVSAVSYNTSVNADYYGAYLRGDDVDLDDAEQGIWPGCVSERTGANAWSDEAPLPGEWYLPMTSCMAQPILPLTSDLDAFNASVDSLYASGGTAGHLGVA